MDWVDRNFLRLLVIWISNTIEILIRKVEPGAFFCLKEQTKMRI